MRTRLNRMATWGRLAGGLSLAACIGLLITTTGRAEDFRSSLREGTPDLQAAGPLAFGPEGILFIGDPQGAAVFAVETGDLGSRSGGTFNVEGVNGKFAAALGTQPDQILINDLAVNPHSGAAYVSVSRGRGPDAQPVIFRIDTSGQIAQLVLENVRFAKAALPNAPPDSGSGRQNQRRESITDLAWIDGRLIVAGLSNEEFASKLRSIPFPFNGTDTGTSVEIYHGAHGQFETRAPVRTFTAYEIDGEPYLLAAYTCTPLVKFPLSDLKPGEKVRGTTVAELGNRNRPLDMVIYERDGQSFILMANSSRGLMKIAVEGIGTAEAIERKIDDTAGLPYDTLPELDGVVQLAPLDGNQAVVVLEREEGKMDLKTIDLP